MVNHLGVKNYSFIVILGKVILTYIQACVHHGSISMKMFPLEGYINAPNGWQTAETFSGILIPAVLGGAAEEVGVK